jgi:hypothetical protein
MSMENAILRLKKSNLNSNVTFKNTSNFSEYICDVFY